MAFPHPIIAIEEHWVSPSVRAFYKAKGHPDPNDEDSMVGMFTPALSEIGPKRIAAMDKTQVTIQVISHAPNTIALDPPTCIAANNELSAQIRSHPSRFRAFATLPMAHPDEAARELRRCVRELGFLGALVDDNCEGRFYDDSVFWPVFAVAEELGVPIYLHPAPNFRTRASLFEGNYPDLVADTLAQFAWGWHSEVGLHFVRLLVAGVFDKFPKLQLVLGHLGEMVPFMLDRIESVAERGWPHLNVKLQRGLRQVWDENVWVTISGWWYRAPMEVVLRQCKRDRICYSVDFPFGNGEGGTEFLQGLVSDELITDEESGDIAYRNAAEILGVQVTSA